MKVIPINFNTSGYFEKSQKTIDYSSSYKLSPKENTCCKYYTPVFCSAKDLTLDYILKKRSHLLPERVLEEIKKVCMTDSGNLLSLIEVHNKVYTKLMNAITLDQAKCFYPELEAVIDAVKVQNSRSKVIAAIKELMPIEDFSLQFLKDLYTPIPEDRLVEKYGLKNRAQLIWLQQQLNITKLQGNYIILLKLSNETANKEHATKSMQVLNNPAIVQKRIENARKATKKDAYRDLHRKMQIEYMKNNPQQRKNTKLISKIVWERCQDIREAMTDFTKAQSTVVKKALEAKSKGFELSEEENKIVKNYYKRFWDSHPQLKEKFSRVRKEVTAELREQGLVL